MTGIFIGSCRFLREISGTQRTGKHSKKEKKKKKNKTTN
jgi:hypothetical protein